MLLHRFEEREGTAEIVFVVHQRLADTFGYRFIAREVDNDFDIVFGEYLFHIRFIAHIGFVEFKVLAAYLFYELYCLGL